MTILDVIVAACLTNPDSRQSQGCKALVSAAYIQFDIKNNEIDRRIGSVIARISDKLPRYTKDAITVIDALYNQRIYVPLINKEF